jgi:hypothetical protein
MADSFLIRTLRYRNHEQRQSTCILVYGKKGKGKSWLVLRLGEILDPKFGIDHVCFSPQQFFALLKTGLPTGSCVLYDEAGVGSNSRDALTKTNKHMSFIAQTIRTLKITVFFTAPSWGLIDGQVRNLMDYAIEVMGHDTVLGISKFKFFSIDPSDKEAPYRKHLVFNDESGRPIKYVSWSVKTASRELTDQYEPVRSAHTSTMVSDADETMASGQDVRFGRKKKIKERPIVTEVAKKLKTDTDCIVNGKINPVLVQEKYKIGMNSSREAIKLAISL